MQYNRKQLFPVASPVSAFDTTYPALFYSLDHSDEPDEVHAGRKRVGASPTRACRTETEISGPIIQDEKGPSRYIAYKVSK